jgi:hypothetical protein
MAPKTVLQIGCMRRALGGGGGNRLLDLKKRLDSASSIFRGLYLLRIFGFRSLASCVEVLPAFQLTLQSSSSGWVRRNQDAAGCIAQAYCSVWNNSLQMTCSILSSAFMCRDGNGFSELHRRPRSELGIRLISELGRRPSSELGRLHISELGRRLSSELGGRSISELGRRPSS